MRNDQGRHVRAYSFGLDQFDFVSENIRHDFREIETRIDLRFKDVGVLRAVWPADADEDNGIIEPFFYLENARGLQLRRPKRGLAETVRCRRESPGTWSTFGPHRIRIERFPTFVSGSSFSQVARGDPAGTSPGAEP
jgi:hypothetical protein